MKVMKGFLSFLLALVLLVVGFAVGFVIKVNISRPNSDPFVSGELSIHFFGLGNHYSGDSIFIQCGDNDILIDAGSRYSSAEAITEYVDQYVEDGVLEYVIATHSDRDHIAGFVGTSKIEGIFEHYEIETIIDFPRTDKDRNDVAVLDDYYTLRDQEIENGAKHYTALECFNNENGASRTYELSPGVEMEILYNYYYENKSADENNYSVCLMFNQGDNHYLFTGDLEKDGEEHLVTYYEDIGDPLPHCVLYKAGHHGSKTSSSEILMEAVRPEYVVVCCCAGTSEFTDITANQFPTQDFINNIAPYTDKVYIPTMVDYYEEGGETKETFKDMNGNIIFTVNNGKINIEFGNNDTKLKDTDWFKENRECPSAWQ